MSIFSQSKDVRDPKDLKSLNAAEPRAEAGPPRAMSAQEAVSTFGPGMLVTGNIVSTGAVQIHGRVTGDIHVAHLTICPGAQVEGKIVAQDAVIDGTFKGIIHGTNVKLRATAVVDGEIYNKSLSIEQSAQFEGVARRLEKAVEVPTNTANTAAPLSSAEVVQLPRAGERTFTPERA